MTTRRPSKIEQLADMRRGAARQALRRMLAAARRDHTSRDGVNRTGASRGEPDALLVTHLPHVRYLTGFTGSNAWLLLRPRDAVLLTDPRYREQAALEVRGVRIETVVGRTFASALADKHLERSHHALGIESDYIASTVFSNLKSLLRPLRIVPTSGMVEQLRSAKHPDEIDAIRRAIGVSEQAFTEVLPLLRPGVREIDIAAELTYRQRLLGADGDAFPPIVLFGARTSLVHGQPSAFRLARRAPILIDFGCRINGYGSDITRSLHFGRATPQYRETYDVVREAQQRGTDAVRAGIGAADVDGIVRGYIGAAGWAGQFEHGLGHGIGLEMHEAPHLSWRSTAPLESGQVITIEPGVYFPGRFGIRIEDDLLVTDDGGKMLTSLPRTLLELDT